MAEAIADTNQSNRSASRFLRSVRLRLGSIKPGQLMPILIVVLIFLLAIFIRTYFGYPTSADNGWLWSGGSDSYYYERLIDHAATTGQHLFHDPMLNFPDGARNPRPPLFTFSVAVPAVFFQDIFGSLQNSIGFFFVMAGAFWGSLMVIPIYLITKEIFGRRTGYVAALFLAIMPSSVERSVATLCDHDSFALFLIVLTVYFLMKSLKAADNQKWVENWLSPRSIFKGLSMLTSKNHRAILYALLAGTSFAAIAMAWVGFTYMEIIILAYFLIELLINKFKGIDSTTHTFLFLVMFAFAFLITFPVYQQMALENMNVPVYLFIAAFVVGVLFSATRDLPWVVVLPLLGIIIAIALAIVTVVYPALGEAIFTGQGYFSTSKLYQTIAEAKPPVFSELALSFGAVTFYLSFIGLFLMLSKVPKRASGDYIIISVWMAVAIFMATSAGRFVFNASPAFAISSAWVTLLIIDKLDFRKVGKLFRGSSGSFFQVLRKSVKIRHVVGALFLVFLLIMPNLWFSLDAGIPRETKGQIDKAIYDALPGIMRPAPYQSTSQLWYLGAFSYSLPLPSYYFPAFWNWLSKQDSQIVPEQAKPAYVSWWDYGFEAIDAGKHPAVADNFQQGYQIAGNILLAPNEEQAIGLMIARLVASTMYKPEIPKPVFDAIKATGASPLIVKDVVLNSSKYRNIVLSRPDIYGPATSDISSINVMWRYLGVYFAAAGLETEVALYKTVRDYYGQSIGYIAVDSRLLPKSATDPGVFYAPVKLTDRTIDENGNPSDYYIISAVGSDGVDYPLSAIPTLSKGNVQIVDYKLTLSYRFFQTMLYRTYAGFAPIDIGQTNDGMPGFSGSVAQIAPEPAWNLTHFMLAYRTAYFNPRSDASGTWQAVSLDQAAEYQQLINAKKMEGIVDLSPRNAYNAGTVTIRYYDGVVLSGKVTISNGDPAPGVRVTVQDKYGISHQAVYSNKTGSYSVILPPGSDTVVFSTGRQDPTSLIGQNKLTTLTVNVSDDQAMRANLDSNNDGIPDWQISRDVQITGGTLKTDVFWDVNSDGNYTAGTDIFIKNSTVVARNLITGENTTINVSSGESEVLLTTGDYIFDTNIFGINKSAEKGMTISPGSLFNAMFPRTPTKISGTARFQDNVALPGAKVEITAEREGSYPSHAVNYTDGGGGYSFYPVLPGLYSITASAGASLQSMPTTVLTDSATKNKTVDLTLISIGTLDLRLFDDAGNPMGNGTARISNAFNPIQSRLIIADEAGHAVVTMPEGTYSIVVSSPTDKGIAVGGTSAEVKRSETVYASVRTELASLVSGVVSVRGPHGSPTPAKEGVMVTFRSGFTAFVTSTVKTGAYSIYLPRGEYDAIFASDTGLATSKVTVPHSASLDTMLGDNTTLIGIVWHDRNGDGVRESNENISLAVTRVFLGNGVTLFGQADTTGRFSIAVPTYSDLSLMAEAVGFTASPQIPVSTLNTVVSRIVPLDLATVTISGRLMLGSDPLREVTIEFLNNTRQLSLTTDTDGRFQGQIFPAAIYDVQVRFPTAPGSTAFYYVERSLPVFVGSNVLNYELNAEIRLKLDGSILGAAADRSVLVQLQGPALALLDVSGTFETFLPEGRYICYAFDETKTLANLFEFNLTPLMTSLAIPMKTAFEITGEPQIGRRAGNVTLLRITDLSSGTVVDRTLQPGNPYSLILPAGTYDLYFEMHSLDTLGQVQRFIKMTSESEISVQSIMRLDPVLVSSLDNSTLKMTITDQTGKPVETEVRFLSMDNRAVGQIYTSDANGKVNSTIHPGTYAIYIADTLLGLTFLGRIVVSHLVPLNLAIKASPADILTVFVTANNRSDVDFVTVTLGSLDTGATIKSQQIYQTNSVSLMVPSGNYVVLADSQLTESGRFITYSGTVQTEIGSDMILNMALTRSSTYTFDASWPSSERGTVSPRESVVYHVTITNTGNTADSYYLSGIGTGFAFTFPSNPVSADPGSSTTVPVTITANPDVKVAHGDIYIDVRSKGQTTARKSVLIQIDVKPVYSIGTSEGSAGDVNGTLFYRQILITNKGNIADNYTLSITNYEELLINGWQVAINGTANLSMKTNMILPDSSETANITFRAVRTIPDGNITAAVMLISNASSVSSIALVQPALPDLLFSPEPKINGNNIYLNDIFADRDAQNTALLLGMAAIIILIFIIRKIKFGRFLR